MKSTSRKWNKARAKTSPPVFRINKKVLFIGLIGVVVVLMGSIFQSNLPLALITRSGVESSPQSNLRQEGGGIVKRCMGGGERCYASIMAQVTKNSSLDHSLELLPILQQLDPATRGCHFIAHSISTAETEKNPSHWKDLIAKLPLNACSGGFIHGVIEATQARDSSFVISASTIPLICGIIRDQTNSRGADKSCAHIMGHLAMVETLGSIPDALSICDEIPQEMQYECFSGVYMENETRENITPHQIAPHIPWNAQTAEIQRSYCLEVTGEKAKACWRELAHMIVFITRNDPQESYQLCAEAPDAQLKETCYQHGVGIMTSSSSFDTANMTHLCEMYGGDSDKFKVCYQMAVGSMINSSPYFTERVVSLCQAIPINYIKECFNVLGRRLIAVTEGNENEQFCELVPIEYRSECLAPSIVK